MDSENFSHFSIQNFVLLSSSSQVYWWEISWCFVKCPSTGIYLMFFSCLDMRLCFFWEEDHRRKIPFYHIIPRVYSINMAWCWPWSLAGGCVHQVFQCRNILFPLHFLLLVRKLWYTAHTYKVLSLPPSGWSNHRIITYARFDFFATYLAF